LDRDLVSARLRSYGVHEPYILCVGKLQARKNTVGVLRAFHLLREQAGIRHKLLFVGRKTWTSSDVAPTVQQLGLNDSIIHTGHVPDEDLPVFYSGADVLAYPSLFEGFGLPVLEAMACGTPVVTSNVTALPEVAGGAAEIVDPHRVEDIARGLHAVLGSSSHSEELRRRGYERVKRFSWAATAKKTLAVYGAVASSEVKIEQCSGS
jgi:glycosyltransferase involved in cell wall biosynthesis